MNYAVDFTPRARRNLRALSRDTRMRLLPAIEKLADDPRPFGCKKLQGRTAWRIRVGDYRVVYEIEAARLVIMVIEIGHRSEIYK